MESLKEALRSAQWKLALQRCDALWKSGAREASICVSGYQAARALSKPEVAETWVDRGLEASPPDWRLMRLKGDFHRVRSEWVAARHRYEQAVAYAPNEGIPHALLGRALIHFGQFDEAAAHLRRALRISRKAPWYKSLASCEMRLGNLEAAREAYEHAYGIDPQPSVEVMIADLKRRLAIGGPDAGEATAGYYDDLYAVPGKYQAPWHESVYAGVWRSIVALLKDRGARSILDLGCGPGQFAGCVAELLPQTKYHGVDFSHVAVSRGACLFPAYKFSELKLPAVSYAAFEPFDVVICTEVLEHIATDKEVLEPVPSGVYVIFSVPNFYSFGHIRLFELADDVKARYGYLFRELEVQPRHLSSGNILWVGHGFRM